MKRTVALLTVTSLLLAACRPQPTPVDPATVQPTAPVAGQALDVKDVPGTLESAAKQLVALVDPKHPNMDPDLKDLLALFGPGGAQPLNLSQPTQIGRQLAQNFASHAQGRLSVQAVTTVKQLLPTGTDTYKDGRVTHATAPEDGYVLIDEARKLRFEIKWKVGGAATTFIPSGMVYNPTTGTSMPTEQEVPTNASATMTRDGKLVAGAALTMTTGRCLAQTGPEALNFSAWAGRPVNAPAQVNLSYAWTDANIALSGAASYATTKESARLSAKLDLRGTTVGRCTPSSFAFTPTRADLTARAEVPSHQMELAVYLRDLSNLEYRAKAMEAQNPLDKIGGTVNGRVSFNGQNFLTASGPLADGNDANLHPGDQVKVKYVREGKLVETDLPGALEGLGKVMMPY